MDAADTRGDAGSAADALSLVEAARRLRETAQAAENAVVADLRRLRYTWSEIADVYDTSKQNAHKRFGRVTTRTDSSGN